MNNRYVYCRKTSKIYQNCIEDVLVLDLLMFFVFLASVLSTSHCAVCTTPPECGIFRSTTRRPSQAEADPSRTLDGNSEESQLTPFFMNIHIKHKATNHFNTVLEPLQSTVECKFCVTILPQHPCPYEHVRNPLF